MSGDVLRCSQRDDDVTPSMNAEADLDLTSSTLLLSDMSGEYGEVHVVLCHNVECRSS